MKNIITAAVLALGITVTAAAPAKALDLEVCSPISEAIKLMATGRDSGVTAQRSYDLMLQAGLPEDLALTLLEIVYIDANNMSPERLSGLYFTMCLSEAT